MLFAVRGPRRSRSRQATVLVTEVFGHSRVSVHVDAQAMRSRPMSELHDRQSTTRQADVWTKCAGP